MNADKITAIIMLIALTFGAGLQVNREHLIAILKNGALLGRAFLANFIIVPIFGVVLARVFQLPPDIATGFLLMAIAPGVPFLLSNVRKGGGSLGLAVALVFFLPLLSIFTVPLTAQFVLPAGYAARVPFGQFLATLVIFQLLPLLAGIAIRGRLPTVVPRLVQISQVLFLLSILALIGLLASKLVADVVSVYGSHGMWAMLCIVVLSLITGGVLGGVREDRRVLATGTALRNIGLCALIATTSFPETRVVSTVLTYCLIQFIIVAVVRIYFARTTAREVSSPAV